MKKLLLLLLAIMLTACSAMQPKSEVEQARDKWQAANISHYRFNLFIGCFCAFRDEMPLTVEVKDGEVVSLQSESVGEINPANLEYYQRYLTIDKLFNEIENGFKGEDSESKPAETLTVTYDETYGFPTQISIDFIEQAVDDELGLTISNFEVLP